MENPHVSGNNPNPPSKFRRYIIEPILWLVHTADGHNGTVTALATIGIAVLTYFLASFASQQLTEMRLEQRPWVAVDSDVAKNGTFRITDKFIPVFGRFIVKMTASGHSPASEVTAGGILVPKADKDKMLQEQKAFCDTLRTSGQRVIFPGQEQNIEVSVTTDEGKFLDLAKTRPRPKTISPVVVGCLIYTDGTRRHSTGFVYDVAMGQQRGPVDFVPGDVGTDKRYLDPDIIGNGPAD